MKIPITFVTGNKGKLKEFMNIMGGNIAGKFEIKSKDLDLEEIQGEPIDIIKAKVKQAAQKVQGPVLVDDVSLCFNAINGLPGPYV